MPRHPFSEDGGTTWINTVTQAHAINDSGIIAATAAMGSFGTLVPVALVPGG